MQECRNRNRNVGNEVKILQLLIIPNLVALHHRTELAGGGKGVLASGQIELLLVTTIVVVFWPN